MMAWMETDDSKHTYFRWKIKWRLEHLGSLGIMGEAAPLMNSTQLKVGPRNHSQIWNKMGWKLFAFRRKF